MKLYRSILKIQSIQFVFYKNLIALDFIYIIFTNSGWLIIYHVLSNLYKLYYTEIKIIDKIINLQLSNTNIFIIADSFFVSLNWLHTYLNYGITFAISANHCSFLDLFFYNLYQHKYCIFTDRKIIFQVQIDNKLVICASNLFNSTISSVQKNSIPAA